MSQKKQNQASIETRPQTSQAPEDNISSSSASLDNEVNKYLDKKDSTAYPYYPGAERDSYDYVSERPGMHKTSLGESIAHLIKGSLGAGVLTMHEAFMYGGLWTSLGATVVLGCLNAYTMYMLVSSAQLMYGRLRVSRLTYPDLAEVAAASSACKSFRKFSKLFRYVVEFSLVLCMCGTCCIYQIMIANTLKQVLQSLFWTLPVWLDNIRIYILLSTPLLIWLCVIRSLKILAPFAIMADVFIGTCVLATLYYSLHTDQKLSDRPAWKSVQGFLKFTGICLYCTSGIHVCLPIENNMKIPRFFPFVLWSAIGAVIVLAASTGFFGYWGWGEACKSPITVHMPSNVFTTILQILLYLMLCITFVIQFWVPFRIAWHYISQKHKRTRHKRLAYYERIYRIVLASLVTGVSMLLPDLFQFMAFLGLFILGFIAFVFPAFIETLITWEYDKEHKIRWRLLKNIVMIIFGFVLTGNTFYAV